MKKSILKILTALTLTVLMVGLAACGIDPDDSGDPTQSASPSEQSSSAAEATPVTDSSITAQEATGEFSISTTDGAYTLEGSVYKITSAGTYVLRGLLEGGIVVDAGSSDEVIIELSGATISYSADSPIKILSADKVEISAKKGTENVINDGRSEKTAEESSQGEGAINSKVDLKLKGSGTLVINAAYNNGINCTKDVTIQKLSLKVLAVNTAIKGKDSVTVKSGTVVAISTGGDGVKTENTDLNKSGESRGDINIEGGSVTVYAAGDGFQAAHSFIMQQGEKSTPYVCIFTGSYSGYTAESASTTSYKGVKAEDKIQIITGTIEISSYDDGLHANYGTVFESGQVGSGAVEISGGAVKMAVYSPERETGGGRFGPGGHGGPGGGPGGWGGQQAVSGADGIHADGTLTISGGSVYIDSAYEGLEANVVNVSGGYTVVTAADDAVNATKGSESPQVNISGGFLDVSVSPNGDVDGIDSNGSYTQTGGVVITRGPSSEMAAAIDAENGVSITGGTLIVLGYGRVSAGGSVKQVSLSLHSEGSHTVTVDGTEYSFTNAYSYGSTCCWSSGSVSGK